MNGFKKADCILKSLFLNELKQPLLLLLQLPQG